MGMEESISLVLRSGVSLSVLLVLIGIILAISQGQAGGFSFFQASLHTQYNSSSISVPGTIAGTFSLEGTSFIFLGFIVLIATPILRVLMSIFYFVIQKNYLYTVITALVFANLMIAILIIPQLIINTSQQVQTCTSCWSAFNPVGSLVSFVILFAIGIAIILLAMRMDQSVAPKPKGALAILLMLLWVLSMLLVINYFRQSFTFSGLLAGDMGPIFPITSLIALYSFAAIAYLSLRDGYAMAVFSGIVGALAGIMVFEIPFMIITLPLSGGLGGLQGEILFGIVMFAAITTLSVLFTLPKASLTRRSAYALGAMFLTLSVWAIGGFAYPSAPIPFLLNCFAKAMGFLAVILMFQKPANAHRKKNARRI